MAACITANQRYYQERIKTNPALLEYTNVLKSLSKYRRTGKMPVPWCKFTYYCQQRGLDVAKVIDGTQTIPRPE